MASTLKGNVFDNYFKAYIAYDIIFFYHSTTITLLILIEKLNLVIMSINYY